MDASVVEGLSTRQPLRVLAGPVSGCAKVSSRASAMGLAARLDPVPLAWRGCLALLLLLPLAGQAEERVLRVVGDENYPPYLFLNADGKPDGFLADLWRLWERTTGIEVELKATQWDEAQRSLLRGDADVIENIYETPQRKPLYEFSQPYADLPVAIYRDVSIGGIAGLDSLRGFRVGVMDGDACVERLKDRGIDTLAYYPNYTKLIQAAQRQDIKVFCLDEYPANFYLYRLGAHRQLVRAFELYRGQFHRAVRKGRLATLHTVEQGMAAIPPAEVEALRSKWLTEPTDYGRYVWIAVETAGALALALALLGFWVLALRRAVAARTAERTHAEGALREREQQLRTMGDNLPDGFIYQYEVSEGPPKFRYVSAGVERMLGAKPQDLTVDASPIFALIPPPALAEYAEAEARSAESLDDFAALLPFDLADGRRRWLLVRSRPRRLADGGVVWDGVALDVTDKREAEARLLESEERFRRLFEDTKEAITLLEDGRFVDGNRAVLDMLGMDSVAQLRGLRPIDISPERQPDGQLSADKVREATSLAFGAGSHQLEWESLRADGERFWAELLLTPLSFADRRLLHLVWRDITEKKRAEAELERYRLDLESLVAERTADLRQSNERLAHTQFAMDRAGIGIAWNDVDTGQFTYANDELCRQLGYPREDLLGLTVGDINPELPPGTLRRGAAQLRASGGSMRLEIPCRRKDGSSYPAAVTVYLQRAAGREWLIAFVEDITARKAAEAELVIAKDAAEAADRAKSAFLANMSHEIRTPMNAIMGMAHLALKTDPTRRQREYLEKIQSSGQHLLGILNDILDFSKIEAGKLVVERIPFDLEKVLDQVASLVAERAAAKGLELIVAVEDGVPMRLLGDPLRIGQVLVNYANNAVKFTERGEIAIRIRVVAQTDGEAVLHFSVRDTGVGISDDERQRLFQSFQQADVSTTRKFGGTGLGLAIAKRLAEVMGGGVGVESTPGVGSTFWFTARLGKGAETPQARLLPWPDLRGRRVLLVDDNDSARQVIGEILVGLGFDVAAVDSGPAALAELDRAAAAQRAYEVVLLDWQMPIMDGISTAREMRRMALPVPPLLLMVTAYAREELIRAAEQVGIADILGKPVSPSTLLDALMRLLGAKLDDSPTAGAAAVDAPADLGVLAGRRVLVVEDNEINREVATELLREVGLTVDVAPDGAVAVEKVQQGAYDLVLMDMQMPVKDGLAATREIRRLPGLSHLPIVAMTANAMAGDRERCIQAGMNDHLAKPVDPQELVSKLLRWVKPRGPAVPADRRPGAGLQATGPAKPLDGIPGLDVSLGLRQVLGREELYRGVLAQLVSGHADTPARLAAALAQSDWALAERLAHTLKGVTAQVGAMEARQLAEQLEQEIRQRAPAERIEPIRIEMETAMAKLIQAISDRLA